MPVLESQIRKVHDFVVAFFRDPGKFKSGNKGYPELIPDADVDVDTNPKQLITMGPLTVPSSLDRKERKVHAPASPESRQRREKDRVLARRYVHVYRRKFEEVGEDTFLYGRALHSMQARAGNCTDMAALACWYAMKEKIGTAWLVAIDDPGDHVFCIIGDAVEPRWTCVGNFKHDRSDAWVIDPWANLYCRLRDYERMFTLKMDKWTQRGKRIRYKSERRKVNGWAVPNSLAYLNGFLVGDLVYYDTPVPAQLSRDKK